MNKMDTVQILFDKYYLSKEDTIGFLMEAGASDEQIETFKRKNATRDKRERCRGFPHWEPEIKYVGKAEDKASNKRGSKNEVLDSTLQKSLI